MTKINPDAGVRNWSALVSIDKLQRDDAPLSWRTETGARPSDEWLFSKGYVGYIDNGPPPHNVDTHNAVRGPIQLSIQDRIARQTYNIVPRSVEEIRSLIDMERDMRIQSGFVFAGKRFQSRIEDQKRINGACSLALGAMLGGAQQGDLRWHLGETDFVWIAENNDLVPMDAQTVFAFGQAMAAWESAHVFAAKRLKDAVPDQPDFRDDAHWPVLT